MTNNSNNTIRVATTPCIRKEKNPYLKLFYQGLRPYGIEVVGEARIYRQWLKENRGLVDLIHLHWSYGHASPKFWKFANQLPRFVAKLALAKRYGYKIVWTVHDFFPHRRNQLALQYIENLSLARFCDGVFVNFRQALYDVHRWLFRKCNIYHIPHGNYNLWYRNIVSRKEARNTLNLPADAFVYLLFGGLRPNRGVELAVRAFQNITSHDSRDTYMIIAGRTWPGCENIEDSLSRQIGHYGNIRRIREFVPDDRVQYYFNAADALVLPYRHIYTSGSAMLALTFAIPLIAPQMGSLPELVHDERIGILYEPGDLFSLTTAMKNIRNRAKYNVSDFLRQERSRYDWELIWPQAAKAYWEILKG